MLSTLICKHYLMAVYALMYVFRANSEVIINQSYEYAEGTCKYSGCDYLA